MYLFSELQLLPLFLLCLLWGIAGWLMALRWFDLETHERGFIGLGVGLGAVVGGQLVVMALAVAHPRAWGMADPA